MNGNTRLSQALDSHPDALELIVSLNPHDFQRLRNPTLRKMMSPRISLRRVAHMAGIPETDLLARLHRLTGDTVAPEASDEDAPPASPRERPDWLDLVKDEDIRWVDLTPLDDAGTDPLPQVVAAWKSMTPGEVLGIRHRWEPQPLYDVWSKIGLEFYSRPVADDEWRIYVYKPPAGTGPARG